MIMNSPRSVKESIWMCMQWHGHESRINKIIRSPTQGASFIGKYKEKVSYTHTVDWHYYSLWIQKSHNSNNYVLSIVVSRTFQSSFYCSFTLCMQNPFLL